MDDRADRVELREEVRVVGRDHVVERPPRVHAEGDDRPEEVALRKAAFRDGNAEVRRRGLEEVLGVLRVEDREVRAVAEQLGVGPEKARPDGVERPGRRAVQVGADESLDAALHLAGGAVRERQEEERRRIGPVLDEARDAVDERARLARARPGDDERRPVRREDDGLLLLVQLARVVDAVALRGRRAAEDVAAGRGRAVGHARRLPFAELLLPFRAREPGTPRRDAARQGPRVLGLRPLRRRLDDRERDLPVGRERDPQGRVPVVDRRRLDRRRRPRGRGGAHVRRAGRAPP